MPDGLRLAKLVRATLDDGGATLRWGVTRELATAAGLRPAAVEALHELLEAAASSEPVHLRVVLGALQELGFRPWLQPVVARIAQRLGGDSPPGRTRWELTWWSLAEAAGGASPGWLPGMRVRAQGHHPLGDYNLGPVIGRGASASVHGAIHHDTGLRVAVKRLHHRLRPSAVADEARALARMSHPAIVGLYELGTVSAAEATLAGWDEGAPYLAMEFVDGGTLEERVGQLDAVAVLDVVFGILEALAHAHAVGVLHLDLKPANILLRSTADPRPVLSDFGVYSLLSMTGARVAGTPHYMPPEQWRGVHGGLGPWTDVYALGCVAFELWAGHRAFDGDDLAELRQRHEVGARRRLPRGDPRQAWLDRCLAPDPAQRYRSARQAALALDRLGQGGGGDDATVSVYTFGEGPSEVRADDVRVEDEASHRLNSRLVAPSLVAERLALGGTPCFDDAEAIVRRRVAQGGRSVVRLGTPTGVGTRTLRTRLVTWARGQGLVGVQVEGESPRGTLEQALRALSGPFGTSAQLPGREDAEKVVASLGVGPAVLSVDCRGPARDLWRSLVAALGGDVVIVVDEDWPGPADVDVVVPRASEDEVEATLWGRLALERSLCTRLGLRSGGDVDKLLDILRPTLPRLVRPSGIAGWDLPPRALLPLRPPVAAGSEAELLDGPWAGRIVAAWARDAQWGESSEGSLVARLHRAGWLTQGRRFVFGLDRWMGRRRGAVDEAATCWAAQLPEGPWARARRAWLDRGDGAAGAVLSEQVVDWYLQGQQERVFAAVDLMDHHGATSARGLAAQAGILLANSGWERAGGLLRHAERLDPQDGFVAYVRMLTMTARGHREETLPYLQRAIRDPNPHIRARSLMRLARTLEQLGRAEEGQGYTERALAMEQAEVLYYPRVMQFMRRTPVEPDDAWRREHEDLRGAEGLPGAATLTLDSGRMVAEARWGGDMERWRPLASAPARTMADVLAAVRRGDVDAVEAGLASPHAAYIRRSTALFGSLEVWVRRQRGEAFVPWPEAVNTDSLWVQSRDER